ncbi:MAG: hypothetical protein IPH46_16080 [Bacteroidetes bacterium]|nr:hypothetical protein [Bacteroidota bacterium]
MTNDDKPTRELSGKTSIFLITKEVTMDKRQVEELSKTYLNSTNQRQQCWEVFIAYNQWCGRHEMKINMKCMLNKASHYYFNLWPKTLTDMKISINIMAIKFTL